MVSAFYSDKRKEELLGSWLDAHLYAKFKESGIITRFKRIDDVEYQKKGVDVAVKCKNGLHYIDEKATLHYINQNIPNFAFELLNRTSGKSGWLFDQSHLTTHYVLVWPNATDPDNITKASDYTDADVIIVRRKDVIDLLASNGLTEDFIQSCVETYGMLVTHEKYKFWLRDGIKLCFTETLAEKPVNILISKEKLSSIACFHKFIR